VIPRRLLYRQWIGQNLPHTTDGLRLDPYPAEGLDGYAWVTKAISLQRSDPEMEFAAALITLGGPQKDFQAHARKAMDGAEGDRLLAQNLSNRFAAHTGDTLVEVFSKVTAKN